MQEKINIFPKIDLLPHPIRRVGHLLLECFSMHQLSEVSDHEFRHPLDPPIEPVKQWGSVPDVSGKDI